MLNVLKPKPGSSFVLFGTGAVGLSGLLAAVAAGATTVIAVDIVDSRIEFAKSVGATHTINSRNEDPVARIKEITGGGADYALDATGHKVVFRQMIDSMGLLGHAAIVGLAKPGTESPVDIGSPMLTGASVTFVLEGDAVPQVLIPQLIASYEAGRFPFDRLIKHYDLEDINQAFEDSESGVMLKPALFPLPRGNRAVYGDTARRLLNDPPVTRRVVSPGS